jgi:hypothetical protein
MREIKFRTWVGGSYHGGMNYWTISPDDGPPKYPDGSFVSDQHMQYTGLKDKNGEEIYVGDVVMWDRDEPEENDYHSEVYFEGGGFYPVCEMPSKNFTVIGNIYENPELSNDKKSLSSD